MLKCCSETQTLPKIIRSPHKESLSQFFIFNSVQCWPCDSYPFSSLISEKKFAIFYTDHLICLLRNLYAGQEGTVRTGHGTTDWFQIGKGVRQGCVSPALAGRFFTTSTNTVTKGGEILETFHCD